MKLTLTIDFADKTFTLLGIVRACTWTVNHMLKTVKQPGPTVPSKVRATDPYGNTQTIEMRS